MSLTTKNFMRNALKRFQLLALLLTVCASCYADKSHIGESHAGESNMNENTDPLIPAVVVQAETQYVLEFPILVTVILRNETIDTDYLNLPDLGLLQPIDSLSVNLRPIGGGSAVRLGPSFDFREQNLFRTELLPGQSKRMLIDLTQFGQPFSAGQYELEVSIHRNRQKYRSSAPVKVDFIQPSAAERAEAIRLRRLGLRAGIGDYGSWQPFLTSNWNTVSLSAAVGEKASRQLALHLALHQAAYGPEPLGRFPPDAFQKLQGGVISAEAASLEYEILAARTNKAELETARSKLLQTWSDIRYKLDRIDQGKGVLQNLRKGYGAEKDPPLPAGSRPYTAL